MSSSWRLENPHNAAISSLYLADTLHPSFVLVRKALPRGFVGVGGPFAFKGMEAGRVITARPPRCVI